MTADRQWRVSERLLDALAAFSLANLCFLIVWRELLFANPGDYYLLADLSARHYAAALANVAGLTFCFYLGARAFRRWRAWPVRVLLVLALFLALLGPLNYLRLVVRFDQRNFASLLDQPLLLLVLAIAVLAATAAAFRYRRVTVSACRIVLLLLVPFALMNLAEAGWGVLKPGTRINATPAAAPAPRGEIARVLWFVFDELDWRLAFEQRPAGVRMPEFDRLLGQSVVAAAREASDATMLAIPSLTIGSTVSKAYRIDRRRLSLRVEGHPDQDWDRWPTVFSKAQGLGSRTAIIGFYHPYCRVFRGAYRECLALPLGGAHTGTEDSFLDIMIGQLARTTPLNRRIAGIRMYDALLARTRKAAADPSLDFIYAHVSVPHGPNIWDARAERFSLLNLRDNGYFDNLALADHFLGEVRDAMEAAGLWDKTAVVVTADHGWRYVEIIGGKPDPRVPLAVKLPGQSKRMDIAATVDAATTVKPLIVGLLEGAIADPQQLASMLSGSGPTEASKRP